MKKKIQLQVIWMTFQYGNATLFLKVKHTKGPFNNSYFIISINPNWHEAGQIYPLYNFWIGFCQLNFYQKFPNIFGGDN